MDRIKSLLEPQDCILLFADMQAGLAFGVESMPRQTLLQNAIAVGQTAVTFKIPIVATTSASKVYSGPMFPALQAAISGTTPIERRNMNAWEDDNVRGAILATGRKRMLVAGIFTEACVSFPVLSALENGLEVYVIADACGGQSPTGHDMALRRMHAAGAKMTSWLQFLLEMQRDWTRHETYDGAAAIVKNNGGGYGIGLTYAKSMIHPT
jgi:nicotinamidase-related amidase